MLPSRDKLLNELMSVLYAQFKELEKVINGKLELNNLSGEIIEVSDSGVADSELALSHHLKRTPSYFWVVDINKSAVVYRSSTAWNETTIYLKCNVANTSFKVFVI